MIFDLCLGLFSTLFSVVSICFLSASFYTYSYVNYSYLPIFSDGYDDDDDDDDDDDNDDEDLFAASLLILYCSFLFQILTSIFMISFYILSKKY